MKRLALVLGGGSAKGFAHIGVLKALEKQGIIPDLIVGTSMGALVGGFYASGKTINEIEGYATNFNNIGSFSLISTLFKDNILNISKVKNILDKQLGKKTHEDCKIKFVSIATEMSKGVECRFSSGLLKDSILASISIPGIFPRLKIGNGIYCDGGIVNNLPEDVAKDIMSDAVVVSVDVIGEYSKQVENCKLKTLESLLNATTLMTANVVKSKPQYADLRLTLSLPSVSQLDYSGELTIKTIKKGENLVKRHIPAIKRLLEMGD